VTLDNWIAVAQIVVPLALGGMTYFMRGLRVSVEAMGTAIKGVEQQLRELNGRLVKVEEWRRMHEVEDERREQRMDRAFAELRTEVRDGLPHGPDGRRIGLDRAFEAFRDDLRIDRSREHSQHEQAEIERDARLERAIADLRAEIRDVQAGK